MLIQEAIKSGKPFRLPQWHHAGNVPFYAVVGRLENNPEIIVEETEKYQIVLANMEILAEDWEIKEGAEV